MKSHNPPAVLVWSAETPGAKYTLRVSSFAGGYLLEHLNGGNVLSAAGPVDLDHATQWAKNWIGPGSQYRVTLDKLPCPLPFLREYNQAGARYILVCQPHKCREFSVLDESPELKREPAEVVADFITKERAELAKKSDRLDWLATSLPQTKPGETILWRAELKDGVAEIGHKGTGSGPCDWFHRRTIHGTEKENLTLTEATCRQLARDWLKDTRLVRVTLDKLNPSAP